MKPAQIRNRRWIFVCIDPKKRDVRLSDKGDVDSTTSKQDWYETNSSGRVYEERYADKEY